MKMDELQNDISTIVDKELSQKHGGSIGSLVGKLTGRIIPLNVKHAPK